LTGGAQPIEGGLQDFSVFAMWVLTNQERNHGETDDNQDSSEFDR